MKPMDTRTRTRESGADAGPMRAKYWLSVSMFRAYGCASAGGLSAYARAWAIGNIADGRSAINIAYVSLCLIGFN